MNQSFVNQLLAFLSTPYGIIAVALGVLMIVQATRSRPVGWLIFSLCCFASSLSTFRSQWMPVPPALVSPLQQIRAVDRPLSIVLLTALVLLALTTASNWRQDIVPKAMKYLIAVQGVIIFKTLLYGSVEFAILSAMTFGGIIYMMKMALGTWLADDKNFYFAARSIAISAGIFVSLNTYQILLNRSAVTFVQGRFSGTTGNPQQAALVLAGMIPCLMFVFQYFPKVNFAKFVWAVILAGVMYFLFLTGSRTGLMMGLTSIMLFYRNNGGAWIRLLIGCAAIGAITMLFLDPSSLDTSTGIDSAVSNRYSSINNTRSEVWDSMWRGFSSNPLFGRPMRGDRLGYGENSWLATGENLGLLGFIPMMLMGWECFNLMWQLDRLSHRQPYYFAQASTVIAGLGSSLLGSCFEAFLLGNITFSLMAFLLYLIMGAYLLEVDRVRTFYMRETAPSIARSGVYQ